MDSSDGVTTTSVPSVEETEVLDFVSMPNLSIKDEPQDENDVQESSFLMANSLVESDPMNLLEIVETANGNGEALGDCPASGLNHRHSGAASGDTVRHFNLSERTVAREKWTLWTNQFSWLSEDTTEKNGAYCVYCASTFTVRSVAHLNQHITSLTHKEFEQFYTAWRRTEDPSALLDIVKDEIGSAEYLVALKKRRLAQVPAFNDFRWVSWLQSHKWLLRTQSDGTHGFCKLCKVRVNVEFKYLRERHEANTKHQRNLGNTPKPQVAQPVDDHSDGGSDGNADDDLQVDIKYSRTTDQKEWDQKNGRWYEPLLDGTINCRCKLCKCTMTCYSFRKHLKSKMHLQNLRLLDKTTNHYPAERNVSSSFGGDLKGPSWKHLQKNHPWLVSDPIDPTLGYCKFCQKRFLSVFSMQKRITHENASTHIIAHKAYLSGMQSGQNGDDGSNNEIVTTMDDRVEAQLGEGHPDDGVPLERVPNDAKHNDNDEVTTENDGDDNNNRSSNDRDDGITKRLCRSSDAWFKLFPWCERYPKNPDYIYCKYCDVLLSVVISRRKHELSHRHRAGAQKHESAAPTDEASKSYYERSLVDKRLRFYPWLVYSKSHSGQVFCKYCRVRFSSACSRKKHENTQRHRDAAQQYSVQKEEKFKPPPMKTEPEPFKSPAPSGSVSSAAPLRSGSWKAKFSWLTFRGYQDDPTYGYCKCCEQRVFAPTFKFAAKHQKSIKHQRSRALFRHKQRQKMHSGSIDRIDSMDEPDEVEEEEEEEEDDAEEEGEGKNGEIPPAKENDTESWEELQKAYPWMLPDKHKKRYFAYCKYCDVRLMISGALKDRHQASPKHREAEIIYRGKNTKRSRDSSEGDSTAAVDLEDEDEMLSLKSERVYDQQSDDTPSYKRARKRNALNRSVPNQDSIYSGGKPRKRYKTYYDDDVSMASRLTAAHSELLRLTRTMTDNRRRVNGEPGRSSLPDSLSPYSLAACLSPYMQQGGQSAPAVPTPVVAPQPTPPPPVPIAVVAPPTPDRNTFDLFFDSVSETVKKLPSDLAAEGRIKVMQIIYELELRALRRKQTSTDSFKTTETVYCTPPASNENPSPQRSTVDTPTTAIGNGCSDQERSEESLSRGNAQPQLQTQQQSQQQTQQQSQAHQQQQQQPQQQQPEQQQPLPQQQGQQQQQQQHSHSNTGANVYPDVSHSSTSTQSLLQAHLQAPPMPPNSSHPQSQLPPHSTRTPPQQQQQQPPLSVQTESLVEHSLKRHSQNPSGAAMNQRNEPSPSIRCIPINALTTQQANGYEAAMPPAGMHHLHGHPPPNYGPPSCAMMQHPGGPPHMRTHPHSNNLLAQHPKMHIPSGGPQTGGHTNGHGVGGPGMPYGGGGMVHGGGQF